MKTCLATGNECKTYEADSRVFDAVDMNEAETSRILVDKCKEGLMLEDFDSFETSCGILALESARHLQFEDELEESEETRIG